FPARTSPLSRESAIAPLRNSKASPIKLTEPRITHKTRSQDTLRRRAHKTRFRQYGCSKRDDRAARALLRNADGSTKSVIRRERDLVIAISDHRLGEDQSRRAH